MRKYLTYLAAMMAVMILLAPMRAEAESADGFRVEESGTVAIVSGHAADDKVSSLQFTLKVDAVSGAKVEFQFYANAGIQEYRYDQTTKNLNIYLSGTDALFAEGTDTLAVGKILVTDGNGDNASATVSVVEDSLKYVYGTELRTMEDLELPGSVQMGKAPAPVNTPAPTQAPQATPAPTSSPGQNQGGNNGQGGNSGSQGNTGNQGGNSGSQGNTGSQTITTGTQGGTGTSGEGTGSAGNAGAGGGSNSSHGSSNHTSQAGGNGTSGSSADSQSPTPVESDAPDETEGSLPETDADTEESDEDFSDSSLTPSEEDAEEEAAEEEGGIDWIFIAAIAAILLLVAVAVTAVIVLNRKPKISDIWDER